MSGIVYLDKDGWYFIPSRLNHSGENEYLNSEISGPYDTEGDCDDALRMFIIERES